MISTFVKLLLAFCFLLFLLQLVKHLFIIGSEEVENVEEEERIVSNKVIYDNNVKKYERPDYLVEISNDKSNNKYYQKAQKTNNSKNKANNEKKKNKKTTVVKKNKKAKEKVSVRTVEPNPSIIKEMWMDDNIKQVNSVLYSLIEDKYILLKGDALPEWKSSWESIAKSISEFYNSEVDNESKISYEVVDQGILLKRL